MLGNTVDFVPESDNKKKCRVKIRYCKRKDHGTLPGKKKLNRKITCLFLPSVRSQEKWERE